MSVLSGYDASVSLGTTISTMECDWDYENPGNGKIWLAFHGPKFHSKTPHCEIIDRKTKVENWLMGICFIPDECVHPENHYHEPADNFSIRVEAEDFCAQMDSVQLRCLQCYSPIPANLQGGTNSFLVCGPHCLPALPSTDADMEEDDDDDEIGKCDQMNTNTGAKSLSNSSVGPHIGNDIEMKEMRLQVRGIYKKLEVKQQRRLSEFKRNPGNDSSSHCSSQEELIRKREKEKAQEKAKTVYCGQCYSKLLFSRRQTGISGDEQDDFRRCYFCGHLVRPQQDTLSDNFDMTPARPLMAGEGSGGKCRLD